jgi:hypothetical protein
MANPFKEFVECNYTSIFPDGKKLTKKQLKKYAKVLQVYRQHVHEVPPVVLDKKIKITSEGLMNGKYQIVIHGIKDEDLYDVEVAVLSVFGRKKNKV